MCLEDLRLGRGRYTGLTKVLSGRQDSLLNANAQRVALVVSFIGTASFDSTGTGVAADSCNLYFAPNSTGQPAVLIGPGHSPFVMRIEDYGQAIMGPISTFLSNFTGLGGGRITEILTDENSAAIGFHNQPPK